MPVTPRLPLHAVDSDYPLVLNTGRVRDHWHTMTRTGKSPRLSAHRVEPTLELHPEDAAASGVTEGDLAQIDSRWGMMRARVQISDGQRHGAVFVPMHWSDQFARAGCVAALVNPVTDPLSGQPEAKHTPVCVRAYTPAWHGFVLSRRVLDFPDAAYCVRVRGAGLWRYELAGEKSPEDGPGWARALLCQEDVAVEWIEYLDQRVGHYRGARLVDGRLESCVLIAPMPWLPAREWLMSLFTDEALPGEQRAALLAGTPTPGAGRAAGPVVCACFGVSRDLLLQAIQRDGHASVEALGRALKAGTNCGSCIPELKALLREAVNCA